MPVRSVFEKTYAYVKRMSYANATVETTQSIRECVNPTPASCAPLTAGRVLAGRGLHEYEVSAVGNLAPSNADEAKALVPSLDAQLNPERKVPLSDADIDAMLNDLSTYRGA